MPEQIPALYDSVSPDVSIIILNYNKPELTIDCLESIWSHTGGLRYEVIVVDNGGSRENYDKLAAYKGPHQLLRLSCNRFFGEGNNIGAERSRGEFLVFMNNDVTVTPNWLEALAGLFRDFPDAGAVGPKFVYPDGILQEAGALLDADGTSVQIGKFQSPDNPRFNRIRSVDYVSAATVMMRRADFEAVLGFDIRYEPAYYEDCDLCLKISGLGRKTYYAPDSTIIHHENATTSDSSHGLKLKAILAANREKFIDRWQGYLETGRHAATLPPRRVIAANPRDAARTAGIFVPGAVGTGPADRDLFLLAQALAAGGHAVTLIAPETYSRLRTTQILDNLGIALPALDILNLAEAGERATSGRGFDVFFCLGDGFWPVAPGLGRRNIFHSGTTAPATAADPARLAGYHAVACSSEAARAALAGQLEAAGLPGLPVTLASGAADLAACAVPPDLLSPGLAQS